MSEFNFDEADCRIDFAGKADADGVFKPYKWGITNGQYDQGQADEINRVTVTHLPTGISSTVSKFHLKRNKEIALNNVRIDVKKWIAARKPAEG